MLLEPGAENFDEFTLVAPTGFEPVFHSDVQGRLAHIEEVVSDVTAQAAPERGIA